MWGTSYWVCPFEQRGIVMDITDINRTIQELEKDSTTFENCSKLASLYIVRDRFNSGNVQNELNDILPQYTKYVDIKYRYQRGEISEKAVETQIKKVCSEISEFIQMLYSCTDMPIERKYIKNMLGGLQNL